MPERQLITINLEFGMDQETFAQRLQDHTAWLADQIRQEEIDFGEPIITRADKKFIKSIAQMQAQHMSEKEFIDQKLTSPDDYYEFIQTVFNRCQELEKLVSPDLGKSLLIEFGPELEQSMPFLEHGIKTNWGYHMGQTISAAMVNIQMNQRQTEASQ